jgi:hypothetical protein
MTQPLMPIEQIGTKRAGSHAGGIRQRYILDEPTRRLIEALYDGTSQQIDAIQKKLPGIPRWKIRKWASQMGLTNQKERLWSEEDVQYLGKYLHKIRLGDIAKNLGRTKASVQLKAKRLGLNKCHQEGYTMRGLCQGLGCDHHKIERWLRDGWITGIRRQTERTDKQGGDVWYFTDEAIRRMIRNHPEEIDLRRVDKYWFLDIVFGGLGELGP